MSSPTRYSETTTGSTSPGEFSLHSPPKASDKERLGAFVWRCFTLSVEEKVRLGLMPRWKENYKLFRGDHWGTANTRKNRDKVTVNLFFANIMRTVANITAQSPIIEVEDIDGLQDQADKLVTTELKRWWFNTDQQELIAQSAMSAEIYGATFEKASWNYKTKEATFAVLDPYYAFPAPGLFKDINDMPYFIHAYLLPVDDVERLFDVSGVSSDNVDDLLGRDREDVRPDSQTPASSGTMLVKSGAPLTDAGVSGKGKALVVEMWHRDNSTKEIEVSEIGEDGAEWVTLKTVPAYPDGIRVTTVCNGGRLVLNDKRNPNINLNLRQEATPSYAWGKFPFFKTTSYEDPTTIWGFSSAEQTGPLNKKIDEIFSRLLAYVQRSMMPPLIVEKGCGISKSMVDNKPGLLLQPLRNARIEFLRVPDLPRSFFEVLDRIISVHDRVYQIEDADRGASPNGITAASAIVALQEKNSVLMQHKIRSIDKLTRFRGRWAISFLQNFDVKDHAVTIEDETVVFKGIDLIGRNFNYIVSSGSTVARTSLYKEEQAAQLYQMGIVDREYVLETLNVQDWRRIIERVGEGQLDQALQILTQAGLPQESAIELRQLLMQPQTGMGGSAPSVAPSVGVPKAQQGAI